MIAQCSSDLYNDRIELEREGVLSRWEGGEKDDPAGSAFLLAGGSGARKIKQKVSHSPRTRVSWRPDCVKQMITKKRGEEVGEGWREEERREEEIKKLR